MAKINPLRSDKGEDVTLQFTQRPAPTATIPNPTPDDITGATITFTFKKNQNDAVALFTVSTTPLNQVSFRGRYDIAITKAQLTIEPGTYWYSVFRTNVGSAACWSKGPYVIDENATNG